MSYFEPTKFTVSGANFIDAQRMEYERAVASADRVVIIGVRVHAVDKHIWDPVANTDARLMYVSGASAATDFTNWATGVGRTGDLAVPKYFREGIPDILQFLG